MRVVVAEFFLNATVTTRRLDKIGNIRAAQSGPQQPGFLIAVVSCQPGSLFDRGIDCHPIKSAGACGT